MGEGSRIWLSYVGLVTVHWEKIGVHFNSFAGIASSEVGSLQTFLQSSLASGIMAGLGFLTGLGKK